MKTQFFDQINIPFPQRNIYQRLGYAKGFTRLSREDEERVEQYIQEGESLLELKGSCVRLPIERVESRRVNLKGNIVLESQSVATLLQGCEEAFFMCATAGRPIVKTIREYSSKSKLVIAVIFDAVASETVDAALRWIMDYYNRELRRENKHLLPKRYSAGYGDFRLENQEIMYNTLKMKRLGVNLTQTFMLDPEKSVTAITGIKSITSS